ncbi:MAG TPA: hypothetical protein PKY53_04775 [Clostridia bacterium]|nr:hypothetical protein [Clostridia bacterium]
MALNNLISGGVQLDRILNAFRSLQGVTDKDRTRNQELINTLKEMESAYYNKVAQNAPDYDSVLPKTTGGVMKVAETKTDEELKAQAETKVAESITEKINKLNETTEKKLNDLYKKLYANSLDFEEDTQKAAENYAVKSEKAKNTAIKRGIAFSSIYDNVKDDIYSSYLSELNLAKYEYEQVSTQIEREVNTLEASRQGALKEYDLEKAAGIEKELEKLRAQQESAVAAVNSYNRKIADAEAKYQQDRIKTIEKLQSDWLGGQKARLEQEKSTAFTGDNLTEMNARYDLAKSFYLSLNKQNAKRLIEENASILRNVLGDVYFKKLLDENESR